MAIKYKYRVLLIIVLAIGICNQASGQTDFSIQDSRDNTLTLSGRSTFRDWKMSTKTLSGNARFNLEPGTNITTLQALHISLPVLKLKSNKRALNKNAYKALKTDKFKTIEYKLTSAKIVGEKDFVYQIATIGNLSVAGVTKVVTIDIYCFANKNGSITCTGKYGIKMTDYNVEPPYFLDGLMSTSESVVINFSMRFER